jgi:hypothetical protein
MGIGAALLDQPRATGQSFYPLSQSIFGHFGYLRHEGYFELTHPRKRKRDEAPPPLGAMVLILKGYADRECLVPFVPTATALTVASLLYDKMVSPTGSDPLLDNEHVFDYRSPIGTTHFQFRSKFEKGFLRAIWIKFFALVKMRRPHFDYIRIVRQTGRLVKECLVNTLTTPPSRFKPMATSQPSPLLQAFIPIRDDRRAHNVSRPDQRPPPTLVRGREVQEPTVPEPIDD